MFHIEIKKIKSAWDFIKEEWRNRRDIINLCWLGARHHL